MTKNRMRFYIVLAIVFVLFSVIAFAVPIEHGPCFWLSYVFAVIAIAVQIYAWPKAFAGESAKSKYYGFPLARVSTIYLIAQLVLSLIFLFIGNKVPIWIPAVLYILLLGFAAIGFIAADTVRDEVERQETVRKVNTGTMRSLQAKATAIAGSCKDPETKKELDRLAESFRYSDPVSSDATEKLEMKLEVLLDELQDSGNAELVKKIESTLAERNQICKSNK